MNDAQKNLLISNLSIALKFQLMLSGKYKANSPMPDKNWADDVALEAVREADNCGLYVPMIREIE